MDEFDRIEIELEKRYGSVATYLYELREDEDYEDDD